MQPNLESVISPITQLLRIGLNISESLRFKVNINIKYVIENV